MSQLTSNNVLQIDATIITGLLILLTIQSVTQNTFNWQTEDQKILENINQQKAQSDIEYNSELNLIQHLKYNQQNATDKTHYDLIQNQINDAELKLYQAQSEGTALLDAREKLLQNGTIAPKGWSNETWIKLTAITMIIPFATSAGWEITDTLKKPKNDGATKGGRIGMLIGFLGLLGGFYVIEKLIIP